MLDSHAVLALVVDRACHPYPFVEAADLVSDLEPFDLIDDAQVDHLVVVENLDASVVDSSRFVDLLAAFHLVAPETFVHAIYLRF